MTIFDDARRGALLGTRLQNWLNSDPNILKSKESRTGWTVLATAVVSGFPKQVQELLDKDADATLLCEKGESPLLLAAWKTDVERPLIISKLLSRIPRNPKFIDHTCELAENNTPLMWAAEKVDVECVRLLAKAGASQDLMNVHDFTVVDIATNTGKKNKLLNALDPEDEQNIASITSNAITLMRDIVSWVDNKFNGFMGKMFGFKGERDEVLEEVRNQF